MSKYSEILNASKPPRYPDAQVFDCDGETVSLYREGSQFTIDTGRRDHVFETDEAAYEWLVENGFACVGTDCLA